LLELPEVLGAAGAGEALELLLLSEEEVLGLLSELLLSLLEEEESPEPDGEPSLLPLSPLL
jgi:hypothetical protein